jgi:hypothetical protein
MNSDRVDQLVISAARQVPVKAANGLGVLSEADHMALRGRIEHAGGGHTGTV